MTRASAVQVDIENTLGTVCDAVCSEPGQPSSVLKARASAMKALGVIFQVESPCMSILVEGSRVRSVVLLYGKLMNCAG